MSREMWKSTFWSAMATFLPRKLVEYAFVRLVAEVTTGKHSATVLPELTVVEALQRWEAP